MAKETILTAILALALVFGMTVVGCKGEEEDYFTVTFDLDGGNIDGDTAPVKIEVYGPDFRIPIFPSPKKDGYIGSQWYTEKNGGGAEFTTTTTVTSDLTVYRKWEIRPVFTVNNIPAEYNGKYALFYGEGKTDDRFDIYIFGGNVTGDPFNIKLDLTIEGSGFKAVPIINGSVSVPAYKRLSSGYPAVYEGSSLDIVNITFYIYSTETPSSFYSCEKSVAFSSVAYAARVVAKSWNDKD